MSITDNINDRIKSVSAEIRALTKDLKKIDVSELQGKARAKALTAYADLTKRTEELAAIAKGLDIDDVKDVVKAYREKAEDFADKVEDSVEDLVEAAQKRGKGVVAEAQSTVARVTRKAPAAKEPAKKEPAKKEPAKKTPAKKTPAKKTPAKKTAAGTDSSPAKKSPATKATAKKSTAAEETTTETI